MYTIYINNTLPPALAVHEIYRHIFGPPMLKRNLFVNFGISVLIVTWHGFKFLNCKLFHIVFKMYNLHVIQYLVSNCKYGKTLKKFLFLFSSREGILWSLSIGVTLFSRRSKVRTFLLRINFFFELISTYLAGWINMYLKAILLSDGESKPLAYIR